MFSFQGASLSFFFKRLNEDSSSHLDLQSISYETKWWAKMDSNHRPHDYQSCALASWAIGPYQLTSSWWRLAGSNRWPPACKAGALPAELNPHIVGVNRAHSVSASSLRLPAKTSYRSVTPPPQMKPASLGFHLVSTIHFPVPSKLNNVLPSTLVWP